MARWRGWFKWGFAGASVRAAQLMEAANDADFAEDHAAAVRLYEESLDLYRKREQWQIVLKLRLRLGALSQLQGDYRGSRSHYEQAVSLARNQKSRAGLAEALVGLAQAASLLGEYALARRLCGECLGLTSEPENAMSVAAIHCVLASFAETQAAARAHYLCALETYRQSGWQDGITSVLCSLGHLAEAGADNADERAWLRECLDYCEISECQKTRSYALNNMGNIERFAGSLDRAMKLYCESLLLKQRIGDEWAIAYTLEGCAAVAAVRGQGEKAARLLGRAHAIRQDLGSPLEPGKQPEYAAMVKAVRNLLAPTDFEARWNEGAILSTAEAIEEVRGE